YRQLVKRQTVSIEDALLQTEMIPEAPGLEEETRDALMQALGQLTEPDREILLRRYYFDQKPKEIAKATGLTVKQVENHLYRTKRRLRETLTEVQDDI
ncbi:MAG: RNA polymerase sigma factor, partial [Anaerovoracaceae bacterium]